MHRGSEDNRTYPAPEDGERSDRQAAAETWSSVKRRLRAELGEDVFASWFARLELDAIADGCAQLSVPTRFLKSWIEAHYVDRVLAVYRTESLAVTRVSIGVRNSGGREVALVRRGADSPRAVTWAAPASAVFGVEAKVAPPVA